MNVSELLIEIIAAKGIEHVFLVPGGGAMHLNDALQRHNLIEAVPLFHEQSAGIAAEYYARDSGRPFGVCMVTSGPGVTNAITALMGAWIESIPVLFISGQAKTSDLVGHSGLRQSGVQEIETIKLVENFCVYAVSLKQSSDFAFEIEQAIGLMSDGRPGPAWIEVPLDIQSQIIKPEAREPNFLQNKSVTSIAPAWYVEHLERLYSNASKPLLYLGHGVRIDGLNSAEPIVGKLEIPTVTTWNALDLLPSSSLYNFGRPGVVAARSANLILQNCDLLICVGTSLNNVLTAYNPKNFAKNAKIVMVDIDEVQLREVKVSVALKIQATAGSFLETFAAFPSHTNVNWLKWCSKVRAKFATEFYADVGSESLTHYRAVKQLSDSLEEGTPIITGSSGLAMEAFYVAFENKVGQRVLHTSGLGSMGYGVPAAIGFKASSKQSKLICLEGDGSLLMNLQDVPRLFCDRKSVALIVMNNRGYASIRATQTGYFNSRFLGTGEEAGITFPSLEAIAALAGIRYRKVTDEYELAAVLDDFNADRIGNILVDVVLRKDESLFPKASAYFDNAGNMHSMPMEDMTPLLSLHTLKQYVHRIDEVSIRARKND